MPKKSNILPENVSIANGIIDLRASTPMFLDVRGALAQELISAYDEVVAGPGNSLTSSENFEVRHEKSGARGAVGLNGRSFLADNVSDTDAFLSQATAFFRIIEKHVPVREFARVGVRYRFEVPTEMTNSALILHVKALQELDLSGSVQGLLVTASEVLFVRPTESWNCTVRVQANLVEQPDARKSTYVDIDQFQDNVPELSLKAARFLDRFPDSLDVFRQLTQV